MIRKLIQQNFLRKKNYFFVWFGLLILIFSSCISLSSINEIEMDSDKSVLPITPINSEANNLSPSPTGEKLTIFPTPSLAYIENPGIGLQYDQTITEPFVGETVVSPPRQDMSWNILNPAEGVYDWSILDDFIAQAILQGKQISFRIYTMRGEDYGGHRVPQWVLDKGATLFSTGDPNYHNCAYQKEWGRFIDELRLRYDGNPNIAFIDISGYGAFNEWNWNDQFTEWDFEWEDAYSKGTAQSSSMSTLDSQSWRRLIDIFAGGSFGNHQCVNQRGQVETVSYSYQGFKYTQLLMPYAGIRQATQYLFSKGLDIGFRYDCLGATGDNNLFEKVGAEISRIWPKAPVVFEFCSSFEIDNIGDMLKNAHASLVHSNKDFWENQEEIIQIMLPIGYRYQLSEISYLTKVTKKSEWQVEMIWQNVGYAPSYPKMGQNFILFISLSDFESNNVADFQVSTDISKWMPADPVSTTPPKNRVQISVPLPPNISAGRYHVIIKIIDQRTGLPIRIAVDGRNTDGTYLVGNILIEE